MTDAKPKLSTKTPDSGDYNTLVSDHSGILALPRERRYAIVELTTREVKTDVASGQQVATMQIVHLESPRTQADEKTLVDLLDKMFKARTKISQRPDPTADEDTPLEGMSSVGLDAGADADGGEQ